MELWRYFWAKTLPQEQEEKSTCAYVKPLWAHLIDVACTAEALWDSFLPESLKKTFAVGAGLSPEHARKLFSLWIGLHDVGKAIPSFQKWHKPSLDFLKEQGLSFACMDEKVHHGFASIKIVSQWLEKQASLEILSNNQKYLLEAMAVFVGFHHGRITTLNEIHNKVFEEIGQNKIWIAEREKLIEAVAEAWGGETNIGTEEISFWKYPEWLLAYGGWATLADWLGSMQEFYPENELPQPEDHLESYIEKSRKWATEIIQTLGFQFVPEIQEKTFEDIFKDESGNSFSPRGIQEKVGHLEISDAPQLTIIEASTGEGKTEAAFHLAHRQQARSKGGGIYVAMPTQATSNSLFERFLSFVPQVDTQAISSVQLIHANASFQENIEKRVIYKHELTAIYDGDEDESEKEKVVVIDWFQPRKRSLLAPYGVGTIDQALLGVLYVKHFFLRLLGLTGKTIIFDEVHAYDTYMSELFFRLLSWLQALGSHVIILSATLPANTKSKMIKAWGGNDAQTKTTAYPAITHGTKEAFEVIENIGSNQSQFAQIAWYEDSFEAYVPCIGEALSQDASVAIICNTVKKAQELYNHITQERNSFGLSSEDLLLFHARYPFYLRDKTEKRVLKRFGKSRPIGKASLLIATQVAEQSLDLDFDFMLSFLAPIDLLLQRAGRLHRHLERHTGKRPKGYETPVLGVICSIDTEMQLPIVTDKIYETLILYRTFWVLKNGFESWRLPQDYRPLIEGVYGESLNEVPPEIDNQNAIKKWEEALNAWESKESKNKTIAKNSVIQRPEDLDELVETEEPLATEEDEAGIEAQRTIVAQTRLGNPSIEVLCLSKKDGRYFSTHEFVREIVFAKESKAIKLEATLLKSLLATTCRLSNNALVEYVQKGGHKDDAWEQIVEKNPVLKRYIRLCFEQTDNPDCFETRLGEMKIILSITTGITILNT